MAERSSLSEHEKALPPADRLALHREGKERPIVEEFRPAEELYRAVFPGDDIEDTPLGKRIGIASIEWPGTDGVSLNRGLFSLPSDVRFTLQNDLLGWAACTCAFLPACLDGVKVENNSPRDLRMSPVHKPQESMASKRAGQTLPENYAHTLLVTFVDSEAKKISRGLRKMAEDYFRQLLHREFEVRQLPRPA